MLLVRLWRSGNLYICGSGMKTKTYIYRDKEYVGLSALRQAIWKAERKAYGEARTAEDFQRFGLSVRIVEEDAPVPSMLAIASSVRIERDRLLSESDYYVMPDYPATEDGLLAVRAYRQALRDVTNQAGFPVSVTWPDKPEVLGR